MNYKSLTLTILSAAAAYSQTIPLATLEGLKQNKVKAELVTYKGRAALRVTDAVAPTPQPNEDRLVVLTATEFKDGVIEADIAGEPGAGAGAGARGFAGLAFRVAADVSVFEC